MKNVFTYKRRLEILEEAFGDHVAESRREREVAFTERLREREVALTERLREREVALAERLRDRKVALAQRLQDLTEKLQDRKVALKRARFILQVETYDRILQGARLFLLDNLPSL